MDYHEVFKISGERKTQNKTKKAAVINICDYVMGPPGKDIVVTRDMFPELGDAIPEEGIICTSKKRTKSKPSNITKDEKK